MNLDFNRTPFVVLWELTRACDLACKHCRAEAQPQRDSNELSTQEAFALIDEIRALHPTFPLLLVLTGGDPKKRPDLHELIAYAASKGLRTTLTPSATPLLQREDIQRMKKNGLARLAISVDGSTVALHDAFRGVEGSFAQTKAILAWAREVGLETQINTTMSRYNLEDFDNLADFAALQGIALWSVFFLVPTGRGDLKDALGAEECEALFQKMAGLSSRVPFDIKSTAAPQYRRVLLQQRKRSSIVGRAPKSVNDGNGLVFISHTGEVFPSGFLPLSAGNVRQKRLVDLYREAPLFRALRDYATLKGKCGVCEYRNVCGGSRARAYAVHGDYLESDPSCVYIPRRQLRTNQEFMR